MSLFAILISALLVNNFVLTRFLGICPFIGVSRQIESAVGMGVAVTFVLVLSSLVTWLIQRYVLIPWQIAYLQTVFFILVIAALVQVLEMFLRKFSPLLQKSLGVYLPLITTNCIVLGVAILNVQENYDLPQSLVHGLGAGLGFSLALLAMSGIRERLAKSPVPRSFQGVPITFITAALMSIAFLGFSGLRIG
ncbi:electron transport complex protein RnfA [Candidatus Termititenax persephonae]|uniref:Ion-translocating oxidoreductase complex subunit A n=1 Tax=Candidatus Termititenax persephonae TaxID=2218525 RepID=A0A388TJU4_9BACT|nr:electron transport complex protein RnfA [Candidatus Termititenax persephonae]